MKKNLKYIAVLLTVLFLLTGCSSPSSALPSEAPAETMDTSNMILVKVNTEGVGEIAAAVDGTEPEFDEEYPFTSFGSMVEPGTELKASARTKEPGWRFVKWTANGVDLSTEETITVPVNEEVEYVAHFALSSGYEGEPVDKIEDAKTMSDILALPYSESGFDESHYVYVFELNGNTYRAVADLPEDVSKQLWGIDFEDPERDQKIFALIESLPITRLDDLTASIPSDEQLTQYVGNSGQELLDEGWTLEGYYLDSMEFTMGRSPYLYTVVFEGEIDPQTFNEEEDMGKLTVKSVTYQGIANTFDLSIPLE
ncbi:MAG: hypothetical protein IKE21_02930 [Erysipelotrichaceae bacterium]|nr:hypothetical protein [Erysipelotrichaceae bacterium]